MNGSPMEQKVTQFILDITWPGIAHMMFFLLDRWKAANSPLTELWYNMTGTGDPGTVEILTDLVK